MDEFISVVQGIFATCKTEEDFNVRAKEMNRIVILYKLLNNKFNSSKLKEVK